MQCRRCQWPCSLWQRGLFSGLCARCQKIAGSRRGLDAQAAAREAVYLHARACLKTGIRPEELEKQLAAIGLGPQDAAEIVNDLVRWRAPYALADRLLDGGSTHRQTRKELEASGLDPELAAWVIDKVQQERSSESAPAQQRRSPLVMVGVAFIAFGLILLFGNVTRLFPTFPYSGFIPMAIGSLLVRIGQMRP